MENLQNWQAGDIVTFAQPNEHIAVVSDKRRPDGVPYILHNPGPTTSETEQLLSWPSPITGHFRFPRFLTGIYQKLFNYRKRVHTIFWYGLSF